MKILVTGSSGFIGKHLTGALRRRAGVEVIEYDLGSPASELERGLQEADVLYHLAGVNRPQSVEEYRTGNAEFTASLCASLSALGRKPVLILSSSIQAAFDNPYGRSKLAAEMEVTSWAEREQARAVIFRLKNVFGKWCRPSYNSVTATFCHNIAHGLPITISDPDRELELVYIDDVIAGFVGILEMLAPGEPDFPPPLTPISQSALSGSCSFLEIATSYRVTLGELAARIWSFRESRENLVLPSFDDDLTRRLYATYLSYLVGRDFAYCLQQKKDPRGSLAEFMKSPQFGQIFVSRTKPGITRGNHYHQTKTEKFLVVEGDAIIRFRHILGGDVIEHRVNGREFKVVNIPPGYAHSIENIGPGELVTLFWASEIFDSKQPDCFLTNVIRQ